MRAFKIVYSILALNFFIPALFHSLAPQAAAQSFMDLGLPFGVTTYPFSEESMFWRVLGIGNVATLGFCCALLLRDLKNNYPVLVPLVFLKGVSVLGFACAYFSYWHPAFIVAVIFDGITLWAMIYFARRGYRELSVGEEIAS